MFTIQITQGSSWNAPAKIIESHDCDSENVAEATNKARQLLAKTEGATHYRVIGPGNTVVVGGPP